MICEICYKNDCEHLVERLVKVLGHLTFLTESEVRQAIKKGMQYGKRNDNSGQPDTKHDISL